ncbi:MAG: serine/threonine protein kinase [Myxococcales bacterium]|nr:serine/threonine protein kinase [Myxococcales bacterium]
MTRASASRSRALSLRAPITTEEERAHFQRRLSFTSLIVFFLAFGFWVFSVASLWLYAPQHLPRMVRSTSSAVQLATSLSALVFWAATRFGKRGAAYLDALDAISSVALCTGWALMTAFEHGMPGPELVSLLASTYTLVVRAALVPSTPARTGAVGIVSLAPLVALTYARARSGDELAGWPAIQVAIWAGVGLGATKTISWVVYGLRMQVRKAMQLGQYQLEEKIGEGGMGAVYRASHAMLRRPTAIKLLTGTAGTALERFEREVQMTARLTHPNTIAVFDYGRTPDGVFYYAMEYLDGVSLEDLVDRHGPQSPRRVAHVLLQVCGALQEAHDAGLVHRDIKPANVMLTTRGGVHDFVKVLDFGLVKESSEAGLPGPSVTNASVILGTPHYMAPEAIVDAQAVDARTDLYALGATAFFMLTGQLTFDGNNVVEVCSKHLYEAPVAPSSVRAGIPQALDALVLDCLAKKPEERPPTASALAARVRELALSWTEDDAAAWWAEHDVRRSERPAAPSDLALRQTVDVAFEDRV